MNKELLNEMVAQKLVSRKEHPNGNLFIYNYTPKVQYERLWNEATLQARGLILDQDMNFVARPFGKFFNLEEQGVVIPNEPFDVFEKLDGSLGILYWVGDEPSIATRGSFESDQAKHATKLLHGKYSHTLSKLDRNSTYLFEIIYPENRIVVDYGKMDDLVLLTVIDTQSGEERIEDLGFPIAKKFDGINDLDQLRKLEEENKEGFVIRFKSGLRLKVKFSEYVRLHRIITGVSNVAIWEYLSEGKPMDELLDKVPDEFYDWVKMTTKELTSAYDSILSECMAIFNGGILKGLKTRKEIALYFQAQKYPQVLFSLLDCKDTKKLAWKLVRPRHSKPLKTDEI